MERMSHSALRNCKQSWYEKVGKDTAGRCGVAVCRILCMGGSYRNPNMKGKM